MHHQGVYKFNWTNFQVISRKIQDMFALLWLAVQCTKSTSLPKYITKAWHAQNRTVVKIKRATSFLNKRSGNQCSRSSTYYTKKFPGGPYKFKEISRICRHLRTVKWIAAVTVITLLLQLTNDLLFKSR